MGGAPSRNQRDQNLHQNVKSSNQNFYPSNQKSMKVDHPKE